MKWKVGQKIIKINRHRGREWALTKKKKTEIDVDQKLIIQSNKEKRDVYIS